MTGWLEGKRALIVGAGSGIGRAVVDAYVEEGARVAALEIDPAKCEVLAAEHAEVCVVQGDATTRAANDRAVESVLESYGRLDVLVCCVGIFDFYRSLADIDADQLDGAFDELFGINVRSHLHAVKAAMPALRESGGSVVLTESTSSYYPSRGGVLYVASKFAVRGLVTTLAYELAPDVRVNGVAPGGTLGTDLRGLASLGLDEARLESPDRAAELAARTPLAVALSGADHAGSYVFLASDRARGITGRTVHTDGGMGIKV
ncbi:3-(cis-5,6-dihydroxycyclohexa-1,3-dien-1-yl)propanoate dehydrogenase [Nocardioides insulae]|uniref:3-(cis-5,6-dihydroxycyclohexa-1, 3-dien-1-yl)propanoate dehydrogenase n=1 Tax=Nocardioides insulae TaxID=394734 RepID=UPI0003FE5B03|nr:3-(cis-5,6-dihydroxycyclohexa-1,3-dien-1-yl)propanoate dehydrogenase [Nocardioides insulae]